jgi:hypothetical protein
LDANLAAGPIGAADIVQVPSFVVGEVRAPFRREGIAWRLGATDSA